MNTRDQTRQNYNRLAGWYDLFAGSEKRFTEAGIQLLEVKSNETLLEIGCGTGHALAEFSNQGGIVTAIDLSEKMLNAARENLRGNSADLCQADGSLLPFPNERFDIVFTSFTLELFDAAEIPKVLSEIRRVLKGGGRLGIVSLARRETGAVRIYEWFHRRMPILVDCRPIHVQPFLKEAGFKIRDSTLKSMWGLPVEIVIAGK